MSTQIKELPGSRLQLTITATVDQYRHAFEHELEHIGAETQVAGFRKGKAPAAKVLERVGRGRVEAGALDHLVSDTYYEAIRESGRTPTEGPKVEIAKFEAPDEDDPGTQEVATFTAEVDVIPQVKIDGYQKISVKKPAEPKIEQDEVDKVIDYLRKQRASLIEAEEDAALEKDMGADSGYEGSVEGVKRTDMKNEHHPLVIGEGQLIPGFEDEITGMKKGERRTITVTFPEEYHASELSGKKARFDVVLHELKRVALPETDDAFAAEYGHQTFAALIEAIKENLKEEKADESRKAIEENVLEELLKLAKFELPKSLVEQELERMYQQTRERLQNMNFNWDTYQEQVKKTADEIREDMRPQAEKNVRLGLALGKVMEEEGIAQSDEAGRQAVDKLVEIATK